MDQKNCEYHPYAQIIPVSTTLEITNSDDVLHNVKTKGGVKTSFNIAQPKFKRKITVEFKNPEIVQVECNVHGWMNAIVVVADNPYDALTDANGSFKITDVPPGKYTSEGLAFQTRRANQRGDGRSERGSESGLRDEDPLKA